MFNIAFKHRRMTIKLVVIVCAMFAFGYALVPLYKAICDITGINVLALQEEVGKNKDTSTLGNTQVDTTRTITVDFDSNEAGGSKAIWSFKPAQKTIDVNPGQLVTVQYELRNLQNRAVVGQAIPSYLPARAAQHFNKLECFCFKQQTLAAGEVKTFPVVFSIDPALGKDVTNITLSYTFFEIKGAS
jgi:cytochrome c oxidase assembly protein subunit 11